jgi:hypothetical protein
MKDIVRILIAMVSLTVCVSTGAAFFTDEQSELKRLERLAAVQAERGNELAKFVSDGCSGGMSKGWDILAWYFPTFEQYFGNKPPWESCCVEHDRNYWRGEVVDGYEKRKQADEALKNCVSNTGRQMKENISSKLGVAPENVIAVFHIIADLMYRAVRIGGIPCSAYSWRWGYGWPPC